MTAQADGAFRQDLRDIGNFKTRSDSGGMVPLSAVASFRDLTGPYRVPRYNLYPAAEVQGATLPGFSTGQALAAMEQIATETLPQGFGFEWTELALQEKLAGNSGLLIFGASVVFVFLLLAAQYESWTLPLAVILIVPMCLLAARHRAAAARHGREHAGADRLRRADRPCRQERHPDRGVRAPGRGGGHWSGARRRSPRRGRGCGRS